MPLLIIFNGTLNTTLLSKEIFSMLYLKIYLRKLLHCNKHTCFFIWLCKINSLQLVTPFIVISWLSFHASQPPILTLAISNITQVNFISFTILFSVLFLELSAAIFIDLLEVASLFITELY
jgi:hypothetical protein